MLNDLIANKSEDRNHDYVRVFIEEYLKGIARTVVSSIHPTQSMISSPYPFSSFRTYSVAPAPSYQIFGFRGYVCDKCLTAETHYVAFPNAKEPGRIEDCHSCHQVRKAAVARAVKLIDRSGAHKSGMLRSLHDKIPILLLEKIVSRSGNSSHLLAVRLSSPQEETIKLPNPVGHSKPPIVFTYSKERHLSLEPSKEFKNDYLTRAIS